MSLDSDVVVIGKVTGIGSNFYYITDENNDIILVYGSNSGVSLGDTLIIKGKRSEYQNCPQISNWEILSKYLELQNFQKSTEQLLLQNLLH